MAVRDQQKAFQASAERDGVALHGPHNRTWLTGRGHVGLVDLDPTVAQVLDKILDVLDGDRVVHAEKSPRRLSSDFIHLHSSTWVEFDEVQHFTSWRLLTLQMYPDGLAGLTDVAEYSQLCEEWSPKADGAWRNKPAAGFPGPSGRARQRAYFDAVRDLCVPAMTGETIIRVPAPGLTGDAAWSRYGDRVRTATGVPG